MGGYYDSLMLAVKTWDKLLKAQDILKFDRDRSMEVRFIEELFVFTKSREPKRTVHKLREELDLSKIDVFSNGVKIYAIPKSLTKGNAICRLKESLGIEYMTAKGYDIFDLIMTVEENGKFDLNTIISENSDFDLTVIVAGDSEFDLTMIEEADMAVIPELLAKKLEEKRMQEKCMVIGKEKIYSDELLEYIFEKIK